MPKTKRAWQGDTFGSKGLLRVLTWALGWMPLRFAYGFAAVLVVPPTLLLSPGARCAYRFQRLRMAQGRCRALWLTYLNHCMLSQVVIDRFAMYAGRRFNLEMHGYEHFRRLAALPGGFVQLSAHVGNYELAGYSLISDQKDMYALVFGGEKQAVMEGRGSQFKRQNIHMIAIQPDMSHLFLLNKALAEGQIVSMPADRTFGSGKTVSVKLLGQSLNLPQGPFRVAVMRGCPVLAVNVMKSSTTTYQVWVQPLDYDTGASRGEQLQQLADAFAVNLEQTVRRYSTQWYNYFDLWKQ